MTPKKCATPGCQEVHDLEPWGVDRVLICPACKVEVQFHLKAVQDLATIWEGKKE